MLLLRSSRLARHHNKTLKCITTIFQIGTVQVIQTISMTNTYNYAVRRQKAPCLTRRNFKFYLLSWKILVLGVGCKGKVTWLCFGKLIAIIVEHWVRVQQITSRLPFNPWGQEKPSYISKNIQPPSVKARSKPSSGGTQDLRPSPLWGASRCKGLGLAFLQTCVLILTPQVTKIRSEPFMNGTNAFERNRSAPLSQSTATRKSLPEFSHTDTLFSDS